MRRRLITIIALGLGLTVAAGCSEEAAAPGGFGGIDAAPDDLDAALDDSGAPPLVEPDFGPPPDAEPEVDAAVPIEGEEPSAPLERELMRWDGGEVALFARNLETRQTVTLRRDFPMLAGGMMRLFPVVTWARLVENGDIDPEADVEFTESALVLQEGNPSLEDIGTRIPLATLAEQVILGEDPNAEQLLVEAIGGAVVVNDTLNALKSGPRGLLREADQPTLADGFGTYLSPCELYSAYTAEIDARFEGESCTAVAEWAAHGNPDLLSFPFEPQSDTVKFRAWNGLRLSSQHTLTAEVIGEALVALHDRRLWSRAVSDRVRPLLDRSLGSGGGADDLPSTIWSGSWRGTIYRGRHWAALLRDAEHSMVLVMMTRRHDATGRTDVGRFFRHAGLLLWEQVVGPADLTPPDALDPSPDWLHGVVLVDADESRPCDQPGEDGESPGFEEIVACRNALQRSEFVVEEKTAASVMIREGPLVESAWFWIEPDGRRHRFQVTLDPGGWWVWTRSFRAAESGRWRLDVYLNGRPHMSEWFGVSE